MLENISVTDFLLFLILIQLWWVANKVGAINWKLIQLMQRANIKRPARDEDMSDP